MRAGLAYGVILLALAGAPAQAVMPESGWNGTGNLENVAKLRAATSLIKAERWDSAQRLLLQVVRSDPEDADGWTLLGYTLRRTGAMQDAREAYERALALRPDHVYARQYFGEMMLMEGNLDGALAQRAAIAAECPHGCEPLTIMDQRLEEFRAKGLRPPV